MVTLAKAKPVSTASAEERAARGKTARQKVPRASHGEWKAPARRQDPVKVLEDQAKTRVPELVPIRYGRMLASPFTFFRGAAAIMAMDLADTPHAGIQVQACGDAHLSNFGVFAAPDRRLVMDVNDFDETLPGPWEWDLKRLAASFAIAGRDRDFTPSETRDAVLRAVRSYREGMRELAAMGNLDVWYARLDIDTLLAELAKVVGPARLKAAQKNVKRAEKKNSMKAFDRLVHEVDGEPRIISDPPLLVPGRELVSDEQLEVLEERIRELLGRYRESLKGDRRHLFDSYQFVDLARKVVGVGSVGTRAWVVLMMGRDGQDPFPAAQGGGGLGARALRRQERVREPRRASRRGPVADPGRERHPPRLASGDRDGRQEARLLRAPALGRQALGRDRDAAAERARDLRSGMRVDAARAHARSGDRIAMGAYLGKGETFDRAIADFSEDGQPNRLDSARWPMRQVGAHGGAPDLVGALARRPWQPRNAVEGLLGRRSRSSRSMPTRACPRSGASPRPPSRASLS